MQLQHARSAAKYRNICRSEERGMRERGVLKRDTPIQKMGMHRRGGRNDYPFRAKRDAGTKTSALIHGSASGRARTTNEQREKQLKRDQ